MSTDPTEVAAKVATLKGLTGIQDEYLLSSVLQSANYDVNECLGLIAEDNRTACSLTIHVTVKFENETYKYIMMTTSTTDALMAKIQNDTNIVPADQMLINDTTQEQLAPGQQLGMHSLNNIIIIHLLTDNSAA